MEGERKGWMGWMGWMGREGEGALGGGWIGRTGELNELIRASTITTNGSERYTAHLLYFFQMLILFTQMFLCQFQFLNFYFMKIDSMKLHVITGQYSGKWNLISALLPRCSDVFFQAFLSLENGIKTQEIYLFNRKRQPGNILIEPDWKAATSVWQEKVEGLRLGKKSASDQRFSRHKNIWEREWSKSFDGMGSLCFVSKKAKYLHLCPLHVWAHLSNEKVYK